MSELNKDVLRGTYEIFSGADPARADELIAPGFVDHEVFPGIDTNGPDGFRRVVAAFRIAFPDLQASVEAIIAEDDLVVGHFRMTGTHQGDLMGIPATGKSIDLEGADIIRCESGKAVEHWGFWDSGKLMMQLGVTPPGA